MKSSKLLIVGLTLLSSVSFIGCTKEQPSDSAASQKASDGLSLYEKAKVARAVRKMEKEEKRKILSEKYSQANTAHFDVKVFFEDEMIESNDMNLWVQPEFIGIHRNLVEEDEKELPRESITLLNDTRKYSAVIEFDKKYDDIDYSSDDYCRKLVTKSTSHSNINMVVPPSLLKGEKSRICRLSYQDLASNKYINEFTEVYENGSVIYTMTTTSNPRFTGREILKTAFSRAVSTEIKDAVRHATTEFFDTEKYQSIDI